MMHQWLIVFAAIAVVTVLATAIVIAVMFVTSFILRVIRVRRIAWIAGRPQIEPATLDRMPAGVRELVAQVVQPLADIGFVVTENIQAPRFSTFGMWSQVLFVNRMTGERASVLGFNEPGTERVLLAFATEFSDGLRIVTEWPRSNDATKAPGDVLQSEPRIDVQKVYHSHRESLAQALSQRPDCTPGTIGLLPEDGEELDWLRKRAGIVAADTAQRLHYSLDRSGKHYRPTWRRALWVVLTGKDRPKREGFDVNVSAMRG